MSALLPLAKGWRFRRSWRGKLVLQRLNKWLEMDECGSYACEQWRDATIEDLTEHGREAASSVDAPDVKPSASQPGPIRT